jgi:hypothetical protein
MLFRKFVSMLEPFVLSLSKHERTRNPRIAGLNTSHRDHGEPAELPFSS